MTIRIVHSHAEGTLIEGTAKGDGVYELARKHGFRYFPSIKQVGIGQSRDRVAKRGMINVLAEALRRAGHEVEVVIDDTHRDREQVLTDQAERLDDRKHALDAKAAKHAGHADAAYQRSNEIAARFEGGQPILVGHHSEKRARADQAKIHAAMGTFVAETKAAEAVAYRAARVGREAARRERPDVVQRRIKKAQTDLRGIARSLDGYARTFRDHSGAAYYVEKHEPATGEHRESLLARKAQLTDQLAYDKQLLAESGATIWGKDNLHVGDLVRSGWVGWREIAKINQTTVGLRSEYSWLDKCPFTDIRQVRCVHEALSNVDPVEDMPADMPGDAPTCGNGYPITPTPDDSPATVPYVGISVEGSGPETVPAPRVDVEEAKAKMAALADQLGRAATALTPDPRQAYFATPAALAERIIREHTDLHDVDGHGLWVLEPSAGTGRLVAAIRAANRDVEIVAVEANQLRADMIRSAAQHMCTFEEFAGYTQQRFDLVVMNPPFAVPGNPTIWIDHIRLAWQLLKPGGRLVAIAPNGYVYRDDKRHKEIRELIGEFGGHRELDPDAFAESGTGIRTVVLWMDKPAANPALSREQVSVVAHAKDGLKCACGHVRQSHSTEDGRGLGSGRCHLCGCGQFRLGPIEQAPVCHGDPGHGRMRQAPPQWCGTWWECTWPVCTRKVLMPSEALLQVLGWTPAPAPNPNTSRTEDAPPRPAQAGQLSLLDLLNA